MDTTFRARLARAVQTASIGALAVFALFGAAMMATDNGAHPLTAVTPSGETLTVQYVPGAGDAARSAATRTATPNKHRGIPPCREEDGSGQRAMCVWDDGHGDVIVNKSRKGTDDVTIVLVDRTPGR